MFVASGARAALVERRTQEFFEQFVRPLTAEARKLGINPDQLVRMVDRGMQGAEKSAHKERSTAK